MQPINQVATFEEPFHTVRDLCTTHTVAISVTGIELLCLKKLSLVSHALAQKLGGSSGQEQATLAKTLDDVIRRIQLAAAGGSNAP